MKGFRHSARSRLARATSLCALGVALVAAGPAAPALAADAPAPTPLPKITKLEPATVFSVGDDLVFISGEHLEGLTGISVDGVPVEFFDEGDGTFSFYTPARSLGVAQVRVTGPGGTSIDNGTLDDLTYFGGTEGPRLDSISPASGPAAGGPTLTIRGQLSNATGVYFSPEGGGPVVPTFGGDLVVVSGSEIRLSAPALAPGRYRVDVVDLGGSSFGGPSVYYTAVPRPTITKLNDYYVLPSGDNEVIISGDHLDTVTGVTVDGIPALDWSYEGDGTLSFITPPQRGAAVVQVRVTGPGGTSADNGAADDLEYWSGQPPTLSSISPASGPATGGTSVTIRGDLPTILGVFFSREGSEFVVTDDAIEVISSSEIRVKAPAMPPGKYEIAVVNPASSQFPGVKLYYTAVAAPQTLQVSPAWGIAGVGGLTVITGKNLAGVKSVRFGTKLARRFLAVGNVILAVAPPQLRGVYPVTVTTAGGTSAQTTAGRYVYLNAGAS